MRFEELPHKKPATSPLPNIRIEGARDPHHISGLQEHLEDRFLLQDHREAQELSRFERRKTREESEIIDFANRASNALLARYGGQPVEIGEKQIHILEKRKLPEEFGDRHGEFSSNALGIGIVEQPGKYPFAATAFHEMVHAKSRISYRLDEKENRYRVKRVGLKLRQEPDKKRAHYFEWMNEAVTEELTIAFIKKCHQMKMWEEETEATAQFLIRENISDEESKDIFFARSEQRNWLGKQQAAAEIEAYSYPLEREALNVLIDLVYEMNRRQFTSRSHVFDVFARAMLAGTLLPLGRLIERTFDHISPETKKFRSLGALSAKSLSSGVLERLKTILEEVRAKNEPPPPLSP